MNKCNVAIDVTPWSLTNCNLRNHRHRQIGTLTSLRSYEVAVSSKPLGYVVKCYAKLDLNKHLNRAHFEEYHFKAFLRMQTF